MAYDYPYRYFVDYLADCRNVLSLCCGIGLELRRISNKEITGVDITPEYLEEFKKRYPEAKTVLMDALQYLDQTRDNSFDAIICKDGIEHLEKKRGLMLLEQCKRVARKKIFIITPEGHTDNDDSKSWGMDVKGKGQEHLSGWEIVDFESAGYKVVHKRHSATSSGKPYIEIMYIHKKDK